MQSAYGLSGTIQQVRNANGPAQHLSCAIVGVILAGMFVGQVNTTLICIWGTMSLFVIFATIWLPRLFLKYTLLVDFVLSMIVLFQYVMYDPPKPIEPVYYTMGMNGMSAASRPSHTMPMTSVDEAFHVAALVWLALWSLYLANLVHRQILERKRFIE